jgi:hypothetical protein
VSLRYLFRFAPGALLLQLRQLLIFAAAAARAPTPPRPPFWGEGSTKKKKIACGVGVGVGHVCAGVGEVGFLFAF